jgi:hypothetical protein
MSLPFNSSNQNHVRISHVSNSCYMPRPSNPPWFDHSNNIWWSVQIIKLLTMQFPPDPRHFLPLRSKYSQQRTIFEHLQFMFFPWCTKSCDSSVGIALGYGQDDRGSRVRFLAGAGNFSLHHRVQNGSRAHSASCPMGIKGSFPVGKAARAWSWPLTSI